MFKLLQFRKTKSCDNKRGFILKLQGSTFKTRCSLYSNIYLYIIYFYITQRVEKTLFFSKMFSIVTLCKNIDKFSFVIESRIDLKIENLPALYKDPRGMFSTYFSAILLNFGRKSSDESEHNDENVGLFLELS